MGTHHPQLDCSRCDVLGELFAQEYDLILMKQYYFQSARGIKVWWKQYITILQIAQFLLDLGTSIR